MTNAKKDSSMVKISDLAALGAVAAIIFLATRAGAGIAEFFKGGGLGIGSPSINIQAPDISISNPIDTTFPELASTDRNILEEIQRQGGLANLGQERIIELLSGLTPLGSAGNPADSPTAPTPIDIILNDPSLTDEQKTELIKIIDPTNPDLDPNLNPNRFNPPGETGFTTVDGKSFVYASADDPRFQVGQGEIIPIASVQDSEFTQPQGEGMFVGGGIFDTPIENLSLSQIVDRFNVSASQASNIQAEARNDFGNFDFGTNTGRGIGSIFTNLDIASELPAGNVSDERFTGLSATEIAQRLTGGNINNF